MSNNLLVCSKSSIQRFIKLWLSLKETPYWFHQTLTLGQQIEDFGIAKPILEKLFDSLEVEMGKKYDMGAVYNNVKWRGFAILLFWNSSLAGRKPMAKTSIQFAIVNLCSDEAYFLPKSKTNSLWCSPETLFSADCGPMRSCDRNLSRIAGMTSRKVSPVWGRSSNGPTGPSLGW